MASSSPTRPAGSSSCSREAFCQRWTGYLLILVPEQHVTPAVQGGALVSPWRRFVGLLRPHTPLLVEAFCCALLMTVLGLSTSYFLQHLVDGVLARQEQRLLNALGIGMVLVLVFRTLFGLLRQYLLAHIGRQVDLGLIAGYARHILTLPLSFFEMRRVGEILSRVNDAAKVREAISSTTTTTVVDSVLVVVFLVVLWLYDWRLALVATAFVPVLVGSVWVHHPATKRRSREAMENAAQLSAHLVEDVSGVETIKAFGAERARVEEGEAHLVGLVQSMFSLQKLGMSINSLGLFVTALAGIVILWYGGYRVMDGALTIGQLMFFYSLLGYLLEPLAAAGRGEPDPPGRAGGGRPPLPDPRPGSRAARRHPDDAVHRRPPGHRAARGLLPLRLPGERAGAGHPAHSRRPDRGHRRREWVGEVHRPEAADGILRPHRGPHPDRWRGHAGF